MRRPRTARLGQARSSAGRTARRHVAQLHLSGCNRPGTSDPRSRSASPVESLERTPKLLVEVCECHLIVGNMTELSVHFEGLREVMQ